MTDMPQEVQTTELAPGAQWMEPTELGLSPGMTVEVLTTDNYLAFLGKVDGIKDGAVILRDKRGDDLPQVMYNREIRLSFKRDGETTMLRGKVCGCSVEIWKLDQLESMFTKDHRASFRQSISTSIEAKCHRRRPPRGDPEKVGTDCRVLDVSSGGLMFSSGESYEMGDRLALKGVRLAESMDPFSFNCQVRRVGTPDEEGVARYGCQFEPMSERDQDRLLRAIFTIQREEIRIHKEKGQL